MGVTHLKTILALMLGLVFQLVQVRADVVISPNAPAPGKSCECCPCPCASNQDPAQKPAPLLPAGQELKVQAAPVPESDAPVTRLLPPPVEITQAEVEFQRFTGYPGVDFSVAFCRYLM